MWKRDNFMSWYTKLAWYFTHWLCHTENRFIHSNDKVTFSIKVSMKFCFQMRIKIYGLIPVYAGSCRWRTFIPSYDEKLEDIQLVPQISAGERKITTNKKISPSCSPLNRANEIWSLSHVIKPKYLGGFIYFVFYITFFSR